MYTIKYMLNDKEHFHFFNFPINEIQDVYGLLPEGACEIEFVKDYNDSDFEEDFEVEEMS